MTGGVAHDFNNLLMIIQGSASGIKRRNGDLERQQKYADAILVAAQRGQSLTRRLLAFARRDRHEPVSFRLQDRSAELKALIDRSVGEDVEVSISIPEEVWPIYADPNGLEVALINLAVNASDAMPNGGKLSIVGSNMSLAHGESRHGDLSGDYVSISVRDTGTGIDEEHLAHIFDPFFTTKAAGKGTGLGLSQVYGFAEQAKGAVTVSSKIGEGTVLTLYLPRAHEAVSSVESVDLPVSNGANGHILLVEDDDDVAKVAAEMLTDAGYTIARAINGSSALDMLKQGQVFDVVVSDIVMQGGLSGLDLAAHIDANWPRLPVVLMTGYSAALANGRQSTRPVVFKPFGQAELLAALTSAMARNSIPEQQGTVVRLSR
jgi:CheY-like chemotaxis protein